MYKGFNLQINRELMNGITTEEIEAFIRERLVKRNIEKGLEKYLSSDAILNGSIMQEDWFPTVNAQVFISHSHQDEKLAVIVAYLLHKQFKIESFLDSFVWGYADKLLKQIDNKYCYNKRTETYYYEKRNYSTSHVHMMLATALTKMIDKTEGLFFLNTPNSVTINGVMAQTYSPWIYHEIATTKIIREKIPRRFEEQIRGLTKEAAERMKKSLEIGYNIDFDNFTFLDHNTFVKWLFSGKTSPDNALDFLYEEVSTVKKTTGRFFNK
jgi:hypothetical protein